MRVLLGRVILERGRVGGVRTVSGGNGVGHDRDGQRRFLRGERIVAGRGT